MEITKIVDKITEIFNKNLFTTDKRYKVNPINFISALICGFANLDGRFKTMSAMRKNMIDFDLTGFVLEWFLGTHGN